MKTIQIYLISIGLLMYMSHIVQHDKYKQQEAQIHRQFCSAYAFHPNCKK